MSPFQKFSTLFPKRITPIIAKKKKVPFFQKTHDRSFQKNVSRYIFYYFIFFFQREVNAYFSTRL